MTERTARGKDAVIDLMCVLFFQTPALDIW